MDAESRITFRPLTIDDLPLLTAWLQTPEVREWYYENEPITPEFVAAHYGPAIRGEEPTIPFLILSEATPIGYIQWYPIDGHGDYAREISAPPGAAGVDLFLIGAYQNQGLGSRIIEAFLQQVVFQQPDIAGCVIGPEVGNARAIRAYEKAGFVYLHTAEVTGEAAPEYIMWRPK